MKDQKEIVITVAGYPGSGKSTVARVIAAALRDVGIKYEIEDEDGPYDDGLHGMRVLGLSRHGMHAKIKSQQRRRVLK